MKFTIPLLALILVLAACQPSAQPTDALPTVAVLPAGTTATVSPTKAQTAEATSEATIESTVEGTVEATAEATSEATVEASGTAIATDTTEPTQAAINTATEAALEVPVYATFTAAPAGTLPPASNLNQVADVVINEEQFQKELDLALAGKPSIQSATVDFVPGAIVVKMTTSGATPISGTVTIPVTLENELAAITISEITTDPMPAPQSYIDVATGDLFVIVVNTLDKIVKARIGAEQKLKSIEVTDTSIGVMMLVP
ncbi:MAG: hypothetical protein H0X30_35275 [Anaerolineae bacterium]|nr:hypothetical protein [Anaerolineae bacterium]